MSDSSTENNTKSRKIFYYLFIAIALIIGVSFIVYQLIPVKKPEVNNTNLNASVVNRAATDSFGSKADLYSSTEAIATAEKQGQESLLKGNDNLNSDGKTNTNKTPSININNSTEEDGQKNLIKRMKSELAPVATNTETSDNTDNIENTPVIEPIVNHRKKKRNISLSSLDYDSRSGDFNSFSYLKAANTKVNSATIENIKSTNQQIPENIINTTTSFIEPINCPAYVLQKTKINGNTTLVVELLEPMTLPNGKIVAKGSRVSGYATINDTRINLNILTINVSGKIEKVTLAAYDLDGMEGLTVKGARGQSGTTGAVNGTLGAVSTIGESALGIPGQLAGGIFRGIMGTGRGGSVYVPAGYKLILKTSY